VKAIVIRKYGSPDVLEVQEVDKPVAKDDELVVRVHALSMNPLDWHMMRGWPLIMRTQMGLRRPKNDRLGTDFAGRVESIGANVKDFKPGDEVFGQPWRSCAEYVCATESALVGKPANLTLEQASAVPVAGVTALQGLRDRGRIQPGQKVLIDGASGGVGTFAVQIARSFGTEVTGVCSTGNVEMVRGLGADRVIDYTKEDFTRGAARYDLILDNTGKRSLTSLRRALVPNGTLVLIGGGDGHWFAPLPRWLLAKVLSRFVGQRLVTHVAATNRADLLVLKGLIESGKVTPVIDRTYPFGDTSAALRYLEAGHARGKVVVTV
jgi:NADPH:quinone reductase-like Zn-dependent oxidoreductase